MANILVVDDEVGIRELLSEILRDEGHDVIVAVNATEARLAREVTQAVVEEGRRVTHVAVKVRTASFATSSKIAKLDEVSTDPDVVAAKALVVLDRFTIERPIRLLGVRVQLEDPPS